MILTTVVSSSVVHYAPLNNFIMAHLGGTMACYLVGSIGLLWPLYKYKHKHPVNYLLLGLVTALVGLPVGVHSAFVDSKAVLEALFLTGSMFASLTGYTFWASKMGKDFNYLGPSLFCGINVLVISMLVQMFFPFLLRPSAFFGVTGAMLFSGFIVYDTDNLIKRYRYDEYILASLQLYLDLANLFVSILRIMRDVK